jgi:hypothetical protein
MKKRPFLLFLSLVLLSLYSFAQSTITGQVTDAETKLPLEGASVFAQNTTKGVITDKEGNYKLYLNKGGYELVISYTGFVSQRIKIEADADKQFNVELKKVEKNMEEVVIVASNEVLDGWEKHGAFFLDYFIGATPFSDSCILLNPEALKFYYYKRSDKLKVLAEQPLLISNKSLGYHLRYQLDSFVYFYKTNINTYVGNGWYTPMEGSEEEEKAWKEKRKTVYYGSRLHFLRSYYDSSLKQNGFTVDVLSSSDAQKFNRLSNPYDTSYYFFNDSTQNAELWFPVKASITYNKKAPEKDYLLQTHLPADVKVQISYIDLKDGILIKPNGFFFDQKSWINQGYWSWKNIADQLPYDNQPE